MRLHATSATTKNGGWNVIVSSACPSNEIRLYYSYTDPLVNAEHYHGKSDKTDDYSPNLFIPDSNSNPVFVSIKSSGACETVTLQAWPAGSNVESITPDTVMTKEIKDEETLQF